jgi:hypothetical protein
MNLRLDFLLVSAVVASLNLLTSCAGRAPEETSISKPEKSSRVETLRTKYMGRRVSEMELEFGPPTRRFDMGASEIAFQWDKIAIAGNLMCRLSAIVDTSKSATPAEWPVKRLEADGYLC